MGAKICGCDNDPGQGTETNVVFKYKYNKMSNFYSFSLVKIQINQILLLKKIY